MSQFIKLLAVCLLMTSCVTTLPKGNAGGCAKEDMVTAVSGGKECLALKTIEGDFKFLVIYLHGDNIYKRAGDRDFIKLIDKHIPALDRALKISIARPGHNQSNGLASSGESCTETICIRQDNIDSIADAMERLISHYKPKHTIVIARSGGAGITATIMGKYPKVGINSAILLSGNYNQDQWLETSSGNKRQWLDPVHGKNNRSADEFIKGIGPDATLYLVAGTQDSNVKPIIAQTYLNKIKTAGKKAMLLETNNGHFGFEEDVGFRKLVDQVISGKGPLERK